MDKYDVVVLGGGPAGMQSAISSRNSNPEKSVALVRREEMPMIPCGIPYIFHTLDSVEKNRMPEAPLEKNDVKVLVGEATGRDGNVITLADGRKVGFDRLVLAFGSSPVKPPIPGVDQEGVYLVNKNAEYLKEFRAATEKAKNVVIVGGGYVGAETADELAKAGKKVTLVEMMPSLLPTSMDPEFGAELQQALADEGVDTFTEAKVARIAGNGSVTAVELENGTKVEADLVVVAAGYRPNVEFAETIGVEAHPEYGVIVDEYMRTSQADVFAAGDCTAKTSYFTGEYSNVMLASTAMAQGRLAGSNLFGINVVKSFHGTLSSFSTKVNKTAFGVAGLTETAAKNIGIDYFLGETTTMDHHPGCLPETSQIHMKLVFAKYTHHLLGAQMSGGDSIGELVNMLSVMIQNKMTDMEIDTLQVGTHPLLTPSPLAYSVITAAVNGILKWYNK